MIFYKNIREESLCEGARTIRLLELDCWQTPGEEAQEVEQTNTEWMLVVQQQLVPSSLVEAHLASAQVCQSNLALAQVTFLTQTQLFLGLLEDLA